MRQITIDLSRCKPCLICDEIVPGIKARIEKSGGAPVQVQGWAWLEQAGRAQLLIDSCPCGAVSVIEARDGNSV